MPKPTMIPHAIRFPPKLWEAAKAKAEAEETDVSTEIRRMVEEWVKGA